ncbi:MULTISPECIES: sulfurtransferase TusA family protein [Marinobacter]|uniref:Sulfurtransferase TusA family protein n=1 Tax=Marinobacter xiaoshiensis TaxID=3073652 RepID=A0ABU2HC12_9GAMM|nr:MULTISPECIES: sulfurtransferase TusA family protein [unclassified Marinobacter]MBK1873988.1 sulfurtransferase TusA family protein [Marinobacter sp. 1-3A]MBK1887966.1 sulfurtransferase TusA family protein [Marinobacter sp. DY40_1A1]MDS1308604.1 sulfurtransferase TusA family protein [Marinobacter sp. F60267]
MTERSEVHQIDAIGLVCPLPVLRFKKRVQGLSCGTLVEFLADDPTARKDLQALCDIAGHRIEWVREEDAGVIRYCICLA